ncbi:MAG: MFS transporter [Chloroflexi bacterium]|nr:MFS transporter [Chloroflexota bacterium]
MRIKLFYGWYIIAAGFILLAYNSWLFIYGWTAFINPILATFGWSLTQLALASSLRGIESGIFNPMWGTAVDRWSARKLMLFGTVTTALGIFLLSQSSNLAMYYVGFLLMGVGSSLVTGIVPTAIIARWFRRDIGKANASYFMGYALGGVMVPLIVTIIDKISWQTTLLYAGIGYLVLGVPLSFVFRDWPAQYGLLPDGKTADSPKRSRDVPNNDFATGVREALKNRAFWHVSLVTLFQIAYLTTLQMFTIPYLTSVGMTRTTAAMLIMVYTLISFASRIPWGLVTDTFRRTHLLALSVGLQTIGLFVFWLMDARSSFLMVLIFSLSFGVGIGGILTLRASILGDYFGSRSFGTIWGLNGVFVTIGGVVAAPLVGWIYDTTHDYRPFWMAGVVFGIIAFIAALTIPRAVRREAPVTSSVEEKN